MRTGMVELSKIVHEPKIYPREKWNTNTIDVYVDVIRAGGEFPPIVLEEETNVLLDGVHRWKAYLKYKEEYDENSKQKTFVDIGEKWPKPKDSIPAEWHIVPDGIPTKLYAASLSSKHGDRITPAERKKLAREVYESNPDFALETLRQYIGVSVGTAHNYVADLLARRKEEQKMVAFRLSLLGWTQEEIGDVIGLSQKRVTEILPEFSVLKKAVKNLLSEGHPHSEVAERQAMPLQLVWAIDMEGRTDKERMDKLDIRIQPYDVWHFQKCHDLFGLEHPGRIPGEIVAHVLYFFTKPGDMIIDPMAGGGVTPDVCLAMGRKCYSFDIDDRHRRSDIITHNMVDGWHERVKKADLVFWDAPYFDKKDKSNQKDGYVEGSISSFTTDEYVSFFSKSFGDARELVKKGTRLAFLMSDWDDNDGGGIFIWDYANMITKAGWKLIRHIQVPLSTQQVHPDIVNKFRDSRRLARLERYLLIAEA